MRTIEELQQENEKLQSENDNLRDEIDCLEQSVKDLTGQVEDVQFSLATAHEEADELRRENESLWAQVLQGNAEKADMGAELYRVRSDAEKTIQQLKSELAEARRDRAHYTGPY